MSRTQYVSFRLYFRILVAAALLACAACGSPTMTSFETADSSLQVSASADPDATLIDRSPAGHPLLVRSAIFVQGTASDGWPYVGVLLADAPALCSTLVAGKIPAGMTNLAFTFATLGQGAYAVGQDVGRGEALAAYNQGDAGCHNSLDISLSAGQSGSLNVGNLDLQGRMHGRFDVAMGMENQGISGTFVAVECPAALKLFDCSNTLACQ